MWKDEKDDGEGEPGAHARATLTQNAGVRDDVAHDREHDQGDAENRPAHPPEPAPDRRAAFVGHAFQGSRAG